MIIENDKFSYTYVDERTNERIIQKDFIDSSNRVGTVTYPNYEMNVIKCEKHFTLCENRNLEIEQWIKNEYLLVENEKTRCKTDISTTFLSVKQGEKVWVIENECSGYTLIKNSNGDVGWIPRDYLDN